MIGQNNFSLPLDTLNRFFHAAGNGDLATLNELLAFQEIQTSIAANSNRALTEAAYDGYLDIVNRLLEFPAVVDAIAAENNEAFRGAARNGYLTVVNRLLEFPAVVNAIAAENNEAFRGAARNGYLTVVNRLLELPAVVDAIAAENNEAFIHAASCGHLAVVNRLLEFPAVVDVIAAKNNEALIAAASCGYLAVVNRLLEFPAVVAAATAGNNEALRDAMHNERHEVVTRLRQIPAVVAYEAEYPDSEDSEEDPEDDLEALAQDEESAIRRLSSTESEELSTLKKHYAAQFQQQGLENILNHLRKYLIAKYQECPARYQGQALPLEYNDKLDKEAIEEYYKNPFHTAFRYLFCQPNPWMAPDAVWVNRNALGRLSANISDSTKENIAYLWLAASDKASSLPDRFVDLLADAGRGHNWDKTRIKTIHKNNEWIEIEEAYDDGEGDKPSCSLGVTKRTVAQFLLLLQPEVKPLSADALHAQFMEKLISENSEKNGLFDKIMALDFSKLTALDLALNNLVIIAAAKIEHLVDEQRTLLREVLSVDVNALKSFMTQCQKDFGERLNTKTNLKWQGADFESYETLIQHFAQNTFAVFYNVLKKKCQEQLRILTSKKSIEHDTLEAPAPVVIPSATVGPAAAPLLYSSKKRQLEPKKSRQKPLSEVQSLLEPFLESGIRRSHRLAVKARQTQEMASEAPLVSKRRCRRK